MEALKFKCKKCGYDWFPRTEQPYKCPRCQSPLNPKTKKVREAQPVKAEATQTRNSQPITEASPLE
jgi:transposase-like protein